MTISRLAYAAVLFGSGVSVGVLWSPLERSHTRDARALSDVQSANKLLVAEMKEATGFKEIPEFARQFDNMTIRTNTYPIKACASQDGRFVIRVFGSDETIASDLQCPERGGTARELVRHYSFSCNGQTYSCDFGRSIDDSKATNVVFSVSDVKGNVKFSYVDLDADGRWDRFNDYTRKPPTFYHRDGLFWKERTKDK
jgi:hypothetical protein